MSDCRWHARGHRFETDILHTANPSAPTLEPRVDKFQITTHDERGRRPESVSACLLSALIGWARLAPEEAITWSRLEVVMHRFLAVVLVAFAAAVWACSSQVESVMQSQNKATPRSDSELSGPPYGQMLIVANTPQSGKGYIKVWNRSANGNVLPAWGIGGSNTHLNDPHEMAADSKHNLWVADYYQYLEFSPTARGNAAPISSLVWLGGTASCKTASGGGQIVPAVALDSQDNLYVLGFSNGGACILVFAPSQSTPMAEIDDTHLMFPSYLIVRGSLIWVADEGNIDAYPITASGTVSPSFQIVVGGMQSAYQLGFDDHGHVFDDGFTNGYINVYDDWKPGVQSPIPTISGWSGGTLGMAMNSSNVFVAVGIGTGSEGIAVYPDTSMGPTPSRLIKGSNVPLFASNGILLE